jgi:SNF2 family DNA or RNA helicase
MKTTPFEHQRKNYEERRDLEIDAAFWEMGTGKSKFGIDTLCHQYHANGINGLLVVAPPGVHRNWIMDEIPTHGWDDVPRTMALWQGKRSGTKWHAKMVDDAINCRRDRLAVLAMNYEAFSSKKGKKAAWDILRKRNTMMILDESQRIKTPGAKRTITLLAAGKYAKVRRVMSGTPVSVGPFDLYSQMKFLSSGFWKEFGLDPFAVFKAHFGVWRMETTRDEKSYPNCVAYKNIEELYDIVEANSTRVLKDDVLDLPDKLYTKRYIDMGKQQKALYERVRDETLLFFEGGERTNVSLAIVKLLRLQQVLCGYLPVENGDEPTIKIEDSTERLDELISVIDEAGTQKVIVWARFRYDIQLIMERLRAEGIRACSYYGETNDDERAEAKARFTGRRPIFLNGDVVGHEDVHPADQVQVLVANQDTAGEGLTLTQATVCVYYSNNFKLSSRLQSEDRAHRIGQNKNVLYVDLMVPGTIDERIVTNLRKKYEVASAIMGDTAKEWI